MGVLKGCLIFAAGGSLGAGISWYFMNKKVKAIEAGHDEEIRQVKESYKKSKENQDLKDDFKIELNIPKEEDSNQYEKVKEEITEIADSPIKIISPEDYEANTEDSHIDLTYYSLDDIVMYTNGVAIENPEDILGEDWQDNFKYGDVFYVSNEMEGAMYEVCLDDETYIGFEGDTMEDDPKEKHNVFEDAIAEGGD